MQWLVSQQPSHDPVLRRTPSAGPTASKWRNAEISLHRGCCNAGISSYRLRHVRASAYDDTFKCRYPSTHTIHYFYVYLNTRRNPTITSRLHAHYVHMELLCAHESGFAILTSLQILSVNIQLCRRLLEHQLYLAATTRETQYLYCCRQP